MTRRHGRRAQVTAHLLLALVAAGLPAARVAAQAPRTDPSADAPAEPPPPEAEPPRCSRARRRAAPALALTAGLLLHGTGHLLACERRTGRRLLAAEGLGVGALVLGGGGIALTGASRKTVAPFATLAILGVGTFAASWLADLYGTLSGGANAGRPARAAPFELALGYRYVHDPQFAYGHGLHLAAEGWLHRTRLFGGAWLALDDDTQRATAGLSQRLLGARGRGDALDAEAALHGQRFGTDGFRTLGVDVLLRGRLELAHLGPTLAGSFVEAEVGLGLQGFGYDATGRGVREDWNGLLLGRVGWGVFLGPSGELVAYYDHRRDDLAGGLSVDSVASGVLGHFGLAGRGYIRDGRWGLAGELELGSALVVGLSVLHRGAAPREGGAR